MENLIWILPLLVCPLGMLLMGAVLWVAARLGLRSPDSSEQSAARQEQDGRSAPAPEAA
jgi:hypothetical protein